MPTAIVYGVFVPDPHLDWPGRNQLMVALAKTTPVILLQRGSARRVARPKAEEVAPNLFFVRNAVTARYHPIGRRIAPLAGALDQRWLEMTLRQLGFDDHLLWLTVADPLLAARTTDSHLVYDCMDPNFLPEMQVGFDRDEYGLARRASIVFASAKTLYERMLTVNSNTYLLPNAAPIEPVAGAGPRPAALAGRAGPVVGYLGTIDWRFDAAPVEVAAKRLPDVTFALVGRINADQEPKVAGLRSLPNVVLPGQVDGPEGDAYVRAFDVGIIPFTPAPMNDAINPVKMWMYLANGLPVVATSVAECRANPFVATAENPDEFAAQILRAIDSGSTDRAARIAYANANTWTQRAEAAVKVLTSHGLLP